MKLVFVLLLASSSLFGQIKNLVFEGGGVRGIAYVGVIKSLESSKILDDVENIAGTSVGAISATLLSVGYNSQEIEKILSELNVRKFNDGRWFFIGGTNRMINQYGWYRGDALRAWINEKIEQKTGIAELTFSGLNQLRIQNSRYKNLFVTATNLSEQDWEVLSYKTYPNMKIADAVRASASIPMYFTAVFMDAEGNIYDEPQEKTPTFVMADGGFVSNYPIHVFDQDYEKNETLGFQLDREEQLNNNNLVTYEISSMKDYVGAFYNFVIESLNRKSLEEEDWTRTVSISTCGVGPKIKRMKETEVQALVNAGFNATENHFKKKDT